MKGTVKEELSALVRPGSAEDETQLRRRARRRFASMDGVRGRYFRASRIAEDERTGWARKSWLLNDIARHSVRRVSFESPLENAGGWVGPQELKLEG